VPAFDLPFDHLAHAVRHRRGHRVEPSRSVQPLVRGQMPGGEQPSITMTMKSGRRLR
jgi:hypothetical protein